MIDIMDFMGPVDIVWYTVLTGNSHKMEAYESRLPPEILSRMLMPR